MEVNVILKDSDNLLQVLGVKDEASGGSWILDATVQATCKDELGAEVGGVSWPVTCAFISGSDGDYEGNLPDQMELEEGDRVDVEISIDKQPDRTRNDAVNVPVVRHVA